MLRSLRPQEGPRAQARAARAPRDAPAREAPVEEGGAVNRFTSWIRSWVETLRIAPPFSQRRRDLLDAIREADDDRDDPDLWVEVERP